MTKSTNYDEVLTLINRRRRAVRSLEGVCGFVAALPGSPPAAVLSSARELITVTARRYGCVLSSRRSPPVEEADHLVLAFGDGEYYVVSELPDAADERREVSWVLSAAAAAARMTG